MNWGNELGGRCGGAFRGARRRADRAWPVATLHDRRAKRRREILQTRLQPVADAAQTGNPAHCRIVGIRVTQNHRHRVLAREGLGPRLLCQSVKIPRAELDRAVKACECGPVKFSSGTHRSSRPARTRRTARRKRPVKRRVKRRKRRASRVTRGGRRNATWARHWQIRDRHSTDHGPLTDRSTDGYDGPEDHPGDRIHEPPDTDPRHRRWHGTILRHDHAFWQTHFPPCGWHCRCTVQSLSDADLERFGLTPSPQPPGDWDRTRPWINRRTGTVQDVPIASIRALPIIPAPSIRSPVPAPSSSSIIACRAKSPSIWTTWCATIPKCSIWRSACCSTMIPPEPPPEH